MPSIVSLLPKKPKGCLERVVILNILQFKIYKNLLAALCKTMLYADILQRKDEYELNPHSVQPCQTVRKFYCQFESELRTFLPAAISALPWRQSP